MNNSFFNIKFKTLIIICVFLNFSSIKIVVILQYNRDQLKSNTTKYKVATW